MREALGACPSAMGKRCKNRQKFLKQRGKKYVFETNDLKPVVIASTASPYKFLNSVIGAVSPTYDLNKNLNVGKYDVTAVLTKSGFKSGEITSEEYDEWRYKYPELDMSQRRAKVPSQKFSDWFTEALKEENK